MLSVKVDKEKEVETCRKRFGVTCNELLTKRRPGPNYSPESTMDKSDTGKYVFLLKKKRIMNAFS